jgi:hypothetical protein
MACFAACVSAASVAHAEIISANCEFHQRSTVDYWGTVSNGFDEYLRLDIDTTKLTAKTNITGGDEESDDWTNGRKLTWNNGMQGTDFVVASDTIIWFGRDKIAPKNLTFNNSEDYRYTENGASI